jgi:hypothetical protein
VQTLKVKQQYGHGTGIGMFSGSPRIYTPLVEEIFRTKTKQLWSPKTYKAFKYIDCQGK